jgi:hypothetical protein
VGGAQGAGDLVEDPQGAEEGEVALVAEQPIEADPLGVVITRKIVPSGASPKSLMPMMLGWSMTLTVWAS